MKYLRSHARGSNPYINEFVEDNMLVNRSVRCQQSVTCRARVPNDASWGDDGSLLDLDVVVVVVGFWGSVSGQRNVW